MKCEKISPLGAVINQTLHFLIKKFKLKLKQ